MLNLSKQVYFQMEPVNLRFGGGAAETMLHPIVAIWMLIAIGLILVVPRRTAIATFFLAVFTIPLAQVIVVAGVHFTVLRILIIAGLLRRATLSSSQKYPGGFNPIDKMVVLWTVSALVIISLQWLEMGAFINALGVFLDALGGYLVVRCLISDPEAVKTTVKVFAVICIIQGVCMINEQFTRINIFGYLGGMPLAAVIRDGKVRSNGVMGNIYAGVLAGALIPLFVWLWSQRRCRFASAVGLLGATAMVITSSSSTSWMAIGGSIIGLLFWPLRRRMRQARWLLVGILTALHLSMKAPVWALIARVDFTGSSSSYHRYALLDNCIRHFSDWWLLGYKYYNLWGWDMWDLCDQWVVAALTGGLITLICYLGIFTRCFSAIGNARKAAEGNRDREWALWCLGSVFFGHVVAHFGINYMAMGMMGLFPLFAFASVLSTATLSTSPNVTNMVESVERNEFTIDAEAVAFRMQA